MAGGPQGFGLSFLLCIAGFAHPAAFAFLQSFVRWSVGAFGWWAFWWGIQLLSDLLPWQCCQGGFKECGSRGKTSFLLVSWPVVGMTAGLSWPLRLLCLFSSSSGCSHLAWGSPSAMTGGGGR